MYVCLETEVIFDLTHQLTLSDDADYYWPEAVNVSHLSEIVNPDNKNYLGFKGFHFADKLGEWPADASGDYKYYPTTGYKGYISRQLSDAEGNVSSPPWPHEIVFSLSSTADFVPTDIFIYFDSACTEFATQLEVRANTSNPEDAVLLVNNRSPICKINLSALNMRDTAYPTDIRIKILKWNKPFSGIKITKLSLNFYKTFTANELINFECSENLFDSNLQIKAGICEQYADIKVYDRYENIHELAIDEKLIQDQNIVIKAIDDDNTEHILGKYVISDWDVPATSSVISITSNDSTKTLNNLYLQMLPVKTRSVDDMLKLCFDQLKNTAWNYIDADTAQYCKSIVTPNSWCYSGTLLETLTKVCLLGMLRIYWHIDSYIVARCY